MVDKVTIYDKDISYLVSHVKKFLQRCQECRISIHQDKWVFCQTQVKFAGFQLSSDGYRIDLSTTEALAQFPTPANRSDLRSFFGLVNQLSSSTDTVAQLLLPLRPLLNTKNDFLWSPVHDQSFGRVKEHLVEIPTLAYLKANKAMH